VRVWVLICIERSEHFLNGYNEKRLAYEDWIEAS
jgi:hypothetical protein